MQEHALIEKDFSFFYRVAGEGEPVVLVHGFAEDGEIWSGFVPELEKKYRLVIPDIPGSGQSQLHTGGTTMEALAEQINHALEKEGITQCAMIGHSMGGYITLAFAEKYPEKLSRFGLFHSTAYADNEEKIQARMKNIDFIKKHGGELFVQQTTPNLFAETTREKDPALVQEMIEKYSNFSPSSLVYYTEAMMNRKDRTDVLKNFGKPVLFIMGEMDKTVPIEQGLRQCTIPGFSYIYIAAHSGHMGMLEEPEFCLKALQNFLAGS